MALSPTTQSPVITIHTPFRMYGAGIFAMVLATLISRNRWGSRVLVIDLSGVLRAGNDARIELMSHNWTAGKLGMAELQGATQSVGRFPSVDFLSLGPLVRRAQSLDGMVGWRLARAIIQAAGNWWTAMIVLAPHANSPSLIQTAFMDAAKVHIELRPYPQSGKSGSVQSWKMRRIDVSVVGTDFTYFNRKHTARQWWEAWLWALRIGGSPGIFDYDIEETPGEWPLLELMMELAPKLVEWPLQTRIQTYWVMRSSICSYWTLKRLAKLVV